MELLGIMSYCERDMMKEKKIKILGLATCFNRKEKTVLALRSLIEKNHNINFDFIIVDDYSTDGTQAELEKYKNVEVITGNGHLYYCGGMRLAIQRAKTKKYYDYCLLFNDDVTFAENSIDYMVELCKDNILVGPTCDANNELSYGGIVKTSKIRPTFKIVKSHFEKYTECDTFNANCVLIPFDIFLNLKNIDPIYTHSLGDFDYGFSARKKGIKIYVLDKYVGICEDNPQNGSWRDETLSRRIRLKKKENAKGLPAKEWFHYLKKNYNLATAIVYSIIPYIRILLKK